MITKYEPIMDAANDSVEELAYLMCESELNSLRAQGWAHYELVAELIKKIGYSRE